MNDHFNGDFGPEYRYKNELLNLMREQTESLKQIAQLLQPPKKAKSSETKKRTVKKDATRTSRKRTSSQ